MSDMTSTPTMERVAAYRSRQRERGYRELRMWVPDVRGEGFADKARRACAAMNAADISDDIAVALDESSWAHEHWDDPTW